MSEKETMARDSTAFGVHETGGGGMMSSTLSARELNATAITELQKKALVRIVDDDEGLRVSYRFLLEGEGWFVRCYESAEDFLENDCPFFPGCIILDVRMPGMSGLELQRFLEKQAMRPRIVFVSAHGSIPMAVKAVKDGAVDFLTKPVDEHVLIATIEEAVRKDFSDRVQFERRQEDLRAWRRLTVREAQIAGEIVQGHPNKVIADHLGISERTVQQHRANVFHKLEVGSAAELATLASRLGIVF